MNNLFQLSFMSINEKYRLRNNLHKLKPYGDNFFLGHVVILQHLSSRMWLLHMLPSITESLTGKSPLDQKILVIVHHRFG